MPAAVKRTVLVVVHAGRPAALRSARLVVTRLTAAGLNVRVLEPEAAALDCAGADAVPSAPDAAAGAEMVIVLGGDGTLLRAAELARPAGTPLLGVNLGHVGFLAEAELDDLAGAVDQVAEHRYSVEERMTVDVTVRHNGSTTGTWALNEASIEKVARERMIEVVTEIDGRPLSRWACDGVVCATPTGSTAYAFSAGGPIVWPEVEALLMVPISAHALFAGPMVVSPHSVLAVEVLGSSAGPWREGAAVPGQTVGGVLWCDGRRSADLAPGARVEVRRGGNPVLLARLTGTRDGRAAMSSATFTDRLVAKFGLPVSGWRGRAGRAGEGPVLAAAGGADLAGCDDDSGDRRTARGGEREESPADA